MNETLKKHLESDTKDTPGALDGDVAVMLQLLDRIERGDLDDNLSRLKREINKIRTRVTWDAYAGEMGPQATMRRYGPRP